MFGWDRVSISRTEKNVVVMFKTLYNYMPRYMQDMFSVSNFYYNIRRSENILHVPKPRTDYLKRSLGYSGAVLWNGLPSEIRKPLTFKRFKKGSSTYIHQRAPTRQTRKPVFYILIIALYPGGGGVLRYITYTGMCRPTGS